MTLVLERPSAVTDAPSRRAQTTTVIAPPTAPFAGLRVCHLGKFYPPAVGGIESHTWTLARHQAALGATVRVVCVEHRDADGKDVTFKTLARTHGSTTPADEADGVEVVRLGRFASLAKWDQCPGVRRAIRQAAADGFDVFHLHAPNPTMTLALAAVGWRRLPGRLVITHHSDVVKQKLLGKVFRPAEHFAYGRADAVFCTSPQYQHGSALLDAYSDKVCVLPLGIDLDPYQHPSAAALRHTEEYRRRFGQPLWLGVGRLVYYKGFQNAVAALKGVRGSLVIVGDGPLKPTLQQMAQDFGVADRVHWLSRLSTDELVGLYRAATAFWLPSNSRGEAYGLVQVEAMACGTPVINAAIPGSGVAWVSRHEETGLTVPVDDPAALAYAAKRLSDDPALRRRLGQTAATRAATEFHARHMAERSLRLYDCVLSSGGRPRRLAA